MSRGAILYVSLLVGVVSLFNPACIDPIDFDVPPGVGNSIVIQGQVVKGENSYVEIVVSRLFDFTPESRQPVNVKTVELFDTKGNEMILEPRDQGYYREVLDSSTPIQAEVGTGYSIRVLTFDGRTYESGTDVIVPVPKVRGLNVTKIVGSAVNALGQIEESERIRLSIDSDINTDQGGGQYWKIFEVFKISDSPIDADITQKTCYVTFEQLDINVLDLSILSGNIIEDYELTMKPIDFRFYEGLFFEVHQLSLSSGSFRYWSSISDLYSREGNMFDAPVGEVPSNIANVDNDKDIVFGYFYASEEEVARVKVPLSLVGNPEPYCPPDFAATVPGSDECTWGLCCDCLNTKESTLLRPSYWID